MQEEFDGKQSVGEFAAHRPGAVAVLGTSALMPAAAARSNWNRRAGTLASAWKNWPSGWLCNRLSPRRATGLMLRPAS